MHVCVGWGCVGAQWDCVPRVYGGGGVCAGGGVPLGAVPALSLCGQVSLVGKHTIIPASTRPQDADFGAATHPGVGGGTHRRRATFERC